MAEPACDLIVPDSLDSADLLAQLQQHLKLESGDAGVSSCSYWDSFDWRVFEAGGVLCLQPADGAETVLRWCKASDGKQRYQQVLTAPPGMPADLPDGALRDALLPVLEMRTLLPLVSVRRTNHAYNVLNEDDKTVVRLQLAENRFHSPDNTLEGPLSRHLCVRPVRGYEDDFHAFVALVGGELGLAEADGQQFVAAMAAVGRSPGDYSSKLRYTLDPGQRADAATKVIHQGLLATLEANIDGSRANLDSEFLHDLRVACRRTRSALTQIKGVFPNEIVEGYKQRFAWLQQVTGPVRDLDVYLLDFDSYQNSLAAPLRPHLEPVRDFLHSHYRREQQALARHLKSSEFTQLLRDWHRFIEAPVVASVGVANAALPVKTVADQRIWKMYRRVRKEGRAIHADSPAEDLHELRKSCKKLRYLMEFFQSLYPGGEVKRLIKVLKVLLDNLGNFQDLAIQADNLAEMAQQMADADKAKVDTLLAMGALVGSLLERQQHARVEFAAIFAGFDVDDNRDCYRALFNTDAGGSQ